jgi:hypothetical protein
MGFKLTLVVIGTDCIGSFIFLFVKHYNFCLIRIYSEFPYVIILFKSWSASCRGRRKIRNLAIPIDAQLKLFDSLITPILVYSCEVWGFENKQGIGKLHLQYGKIFLYKAYNALFA